MLVRGIGEAGAVGEDRQELDTGLLGIVQRGVEVSNVQVSASGCTADQSKSERTQAIPAPRMCSKAVARVGNSWPRVTCAQTPYGEGTASAQTEQAKAASPQKNAYLIAKTP